MVSKAAECLRRTAPGLTGIVRIFNREQVGLIWTVPSFVVLVEVATTPAQSDSSLVVIEMLAVVL